ncbi:hypothetical protein PoB_000890900 [Plakobranchus ocellatus]|uniref:RNase H type-1 domain-containing protein n=1 Tax=Plakobranchus ocellatus TaxID=259542 RepID=A0AAV3YK41_9GAST|nr:hypothetical protein PoB_000890900 [Plakobranchus ocellatus]
MDGSSTEDKFIFYSLVVLLSHLCKSVEEKTCKLKVLAKCLRKIIRWHREKSLLSNIVIFSDCQALVQALKSSGRADVKVVIADTLTWIQWLPSHVTIISDGQVHALANRGNHVL